MKLQSTLPAAIGVAMLFSCSNGDETPNDNQINLSESSIEIDVDQDIKLETSFNREGYSNNEFESDSPIVASVDSDGTITGKIKGETTIRVTTNDGQFSGECQVKVNPTNFLYVEPLFAFGEGMEYFKTHEQRTLGNQSDDGLVFNDSNVDVELVMYLFENSKMYGGAVILKSTESVAEKTIDFLAQRYIPIGNENDVYYFADNDVVAGVTVDSQLGLTVLYLEFTESENGRMDVKVAIKDGFEKLKSKR
ncbi:hypothetical protein DN752_13260 [Echinicola strongylocentroti]|uniref:BIG2 domain-containing protein n=1 Tax=Echinicola strongylocentroti TaxID=1795355 RepID=A0A2Z4IKW4_9BACT|nr:Ig-like domain-containing protein [Echinicola strongylocentroti]AWW31013.1 hypothetical protein DN752_13260 [Echinicola strongylocentroti]